jgi:CubicO group peptidase (beta-lactamase class C family)
VGGVVSTVIDLLKYARFHMSDGSGLLKPETLKLMQTPIVTGSGLDVFGLSWFITPIGGTPVLRHGGATHGFTADFTIVPSRQFAITTLTNSDEGSSLYDDLRARPYSTISAWCGLRRRSSSYRKSSCWRTPGVMIRRWRSVNCIYKTAH